MLQVFFSLFTNCQTAHDIPDSLGSEAAVTAASIPCRSSKSDLSRCSGDFQLIICQNAAKLYGLKATTPMDPRVLDAMLPFMTDIYGNPHSRTHAYGWEAEKAVDEARRVRPRHLKC